MIRICRQPDDCFALMQAGELNLSDDGVDRTGKPVPKPWGHEVEIYHADTLSICRLSLRAGAETSMHCHPGKTAVIVVEKGECILETLDGTREMEAGEVAYIQEGAFHRTKAITDAVLIELETPPNKNDLVRLNDRYGRGQGYEVTGAQTP